MIQHLDMTSALEDSLWADACLAADVFALMMREGLPQKAGVLVKAHAGPVRDAWLAHVKSLLPTSADMHQVPVNISVERLLGGLDLGLTLAKGKAVEMRGVLSSADQNILFLPMAGLADPSVISIIAASMDSGDVRIERDGISKVSPARFGLICFDESSDGEDAVSAALTDRVMLHIDLRAVSVRAIQKRPPKALASQTHARLSDDLRRQLCELPTAFGLHSLRPGLQMTMLTKALARLDGDADVTQEHVSAAIRLSLVHRALQMPAPPSEDREEETSEPPPPDAPPPDDPGRSEDSREEAANDTALPDDMVLETVQASLPHGLLAYLKAGRAGQSKRPSAGRQGGRVLGGKRGRPLASRKGALGAGKRLDLIATLRAAAPFQKARRDAGVGNAKVHVRASDFHIRRYQERSETVTIFVVDASGSTALNRLREAKGAVELLLGESYARRDYVALISFRGREAQVLLPPTRALVRAKRSLSSLPGGGGSPLASGIQTALQMAEDERKRGREPSIVIMTDGSANVDAKGAGGRKQAAEDAEKSARAVAFAGVPAILVDIGRQPKDKARHLAHLMDATYLPMPFAQSKELTDVLGARL